MQRLCVTNALIGQAGWPNGSLTTTWPWRHIRNRWKRFFFLSRALGQGGACCVGGSSFAHGRHLQQEGSFRAVRLLIYMDHEGIANAPKCHEMSMQNIRQNVVPAGVPPRLGVSEVTFGVCR